MNDRHLVLAALDSALRRRKPKGGLVHHSVRGSQYASEDYQRLLASHEMTCSMSRRGNCYDNAVVESWFRTLKSELGEKFQSHDAAKVQLFEYIEGFYNSRRMHTSLGFKSPLEFERDALAATPHAPAAAAVPSHPTQQENSTTQPN